MDEIISLCLEPESRRDEAWEKKFLELFPQAKVSIANPEPQYGPDGWPYILVKLEQESQEPSMKVIDWIYNRGIGLAVNTHKQIPDYIFNFGMLWYYKQSGIFQSEQLNVEQGEISVKAGTQMYFGQPSEEYLPKYVRDLIKEFLKQQGVAEPKIVLSTFDRENFDICFSVESLGSPPKAEYEGILRAIAWFLPEHYPVSFLSEEKYGEHFEAL